MPFTYPFEAKEPPPGSDKAEIAWMLDDAAGGTTHDEDVGEEPVDSAGSACELGPRLFDLAAAASASGSRGGGGGGGGSGGGNHAGAQRKPLKLKQAAAASLAFLEQSVEPPPAPRSRATPPWPATHPPLRPPRYAQVALPAGLAGVKELGVRKLLAPVFAGAFGCGAVAAALAPGGVLARLGVVVPCGLAAIGSVDLRVLTAADVRAAIDAALAAGAACAAGAAQAVELTLCYVDDGAFLEELLPVCFNTLLPLIGVRGIGALMATSRAAARDVAASAAEAKFAEPDVGVAPERAAAFAARFPLARALTISRTIYVGSPLSPAQAADVAAAVAGLNHLTTLSLSGVALGPAGMEELAAALRGRSALRTLDLSGCDIREAGAAALGSALAHMPFLESLRLSQCRIGSRGLEALAPTLLCTLQLRALDVSRNGVNVSVSGQALVGPSAGLASLCGVLHLLPLLEDLDLRDNFVGHVGRTTLAAAAQKQRIKLLL